MGHLDCDTSDPRIWGVPNRLRPIWTSEPRFGRVQMGHLDRSKGLLWTLKKEGASCCSNSGSPEVAKCRHTSYIYIRTCQRYFSRVLRILLEARFTNIFYCFWGPKNAKKCIFAVLEAVFPNISYWKKGRKPGFPENAKKRKKSTKFC